MKTEPDNTVPIPGIPLMTMQRALELQRQSLRGWEAILKPAVYGALARWASAPNGRTTKPDDIRRGEEIDRWVRLYAAGGTPPSE